MEVMEEGNLMDRVQILIQRDLQYYQEKQTVLQETICSGVVGGKLDFPMYASFAAVKLVLWWEEEYIAAYRKGSGLMQSSDADDDLEDVSGGCGGVVNASDPEKFVSMVTKSAENLLDHLHILSQEALDHADLAVLTGTLGASALIKNCMWCYIQTSGGNLIQSESGTLQYSYKQYSEMAEALAERLLDLHCRLVSLYILQDAESLHWESTKPFFESERGSFSIQMWWFYMQGTREDLWNTVPPKIAQRIFSGMLNESLTILTVRYMQARPTEARSKLLVTDISNLLLCITELLPSICESSEEFAGLSLNSNNKLLRDIHAKCHELLICLLLRATPLELLHKVFKRGVQNAEILKTRHGLLTPWLLLTSPEIFPFNKNNPISRVSELNDASAIALELRILLAQPQPNWPHLLWILLMRDCKISKLILKFVLKSIAVSTFSVDTFKLDKTVCGHFLCGADGTCKYPDEKSYTNSEKLYSELSEAIIYVVSTVGSKDHMREVILPALEESGRDWAVCLDRRQVWSQNRPSWLNALLTPIKPLLPPIVTTLISAVQTGASMYQAMSLTLACFNQLWDCFPSNIYTMASLLSEILPADVHPLANSVLLQLLISALYTALYEKTIEANTQTSTNVKTEGVSVATSNQTVVQDDSKVNSSKVKSEISHKDSVLSFDGTINDVPSIALALTEALCSIDEDNKHTEQIDEFLSQTVDFEVKDEVNISEQNIHYLEVLASEILITVEGKLSLKMLYKFMIHNQEWILQQIGAKKIFKPLEPNKLNTAETPFLYGVFHIGERPFDQLLTGSWRPHWFQLFQMPLGLSSDRIWAQLKQRWEFQDDQTQLNDHDATVVTSLTSYLKNN